MPDHVPADLRRSWVERGWCPDSDLFTLFRGHVARQPSAPAVVDPEGFLDYGELHRRVLRVAAALADAGIGPSDVVAVSVPNGWRAVAAELAVSALGGVVLAVPPGRGWLDTVRLLSRSRASALVVADRYRNDAPAEAVAERCARLPHLGSIHVFGDPPPGCRGLDPWIQRRADPAVALPDPPDPEFPARILVSSGTESEPKMVAYSHNAMGGGRANYVAALHAGQPIESLLLVPLGSSFGSCGTSGIVARHGGTLYLLGDFDAGRALRAIYEWEPAFVYGVPTMLRRIAELPASGPAPSLRGLVSSGGFLDRATADQCSARLGCPVHNVYGSTDGVNCHTSWPDPSPEPGYVGRPDPSVAELRLAGEGGEASGEGEIWARGPMTPLCYFNAPELDRRLRGPEGWVRTGDRGRFDSQGRLFVLDRLGRVVIRGGFNISPREVEEQVMRHPGVRDAACFGVPDPDLGERLAVCLVPRDGAQAVGLEELADFLAGQGVTRAKRPEYLLCLEELPLGPTGKVDHAELSRTFKRRFGGAGPAPSRSRRTTP